MSGGVFVAIAAAIANFLLGWDDVITAVEWMLTITQARSTSAAGEESLVTCEKLLRMGIVVDQTYCLCCREDETFDHLFYGREVAGRVFKEVTKWSGVERDPQGWNEEKRFMLTQCRTKSGKQGMFRCVLTIVVYEIGKERNSRRMRNKVSSASDGAVLLALYRFR